MLITMDDEEFDIVKFIESAPQRANDFSHWLGSQSCPSPRSLSPDSSIELLNTYGSDDSALKPFLEEATKEEKVLPP